MAYSVSQNTSLYTLASILQKAVSFVYFTIIARAIGVTSTGQYFFAISFTTIFSVVADFGLAPVLTRETAKYPDRADDYLTTVFWAKVLFGIVTYGLVVFAVQLLNYDAALTKLIYVSGLTMFFDNLTTTFFSVLRARRNLLYESMGIVLSQVITMTIGLTAIYSHWDLWTLIAAYTVASFCTLVFAAKSLRRAYAIFFHWRFSGATFKTLLAFAIPFGIAGIIGRLYSYSDTVLMSKLLDPVHLGWWSVPYKMTFAFQFIPAALSASIYPVMSSLTVANPAKVSELFHKAWQYLLLVSLPLAFGLAGIAEPLIRLLYGQEYAPSVPVLQILLASVVFGFLSFVTGATLNATNHQKQQTGLLAVTLVVNIVLNLILIPRMATIGAAIAALIGNVMLAVGGFLLARRAVAIPFGPIVVYAQRVFWPALTMGALVYFLTPRFTLFLTIPFGVVVYVALLFVTGGVTSAMIGEFRQKMFAKAL